MAKVVLGLATPHSPQLSTPLELWHLHAERDRTNPFIDFEAQKAKAPADIHEHLTEEAWKQKYDACQDALKTISNMLQETNPDVIVVIGDDQKELFLNDNMPTFALYWGKEIYDYPQDPNELPESIRPALWARHGEVPEAYPIAHELTQHIIKTLVQNEYDVAQFTEQPGNRSIGHAHTFVRRRLLQDKPMIPMVPVFINCIFPPNVPSAKRSYEFGQTIRKAIDSWDGAERVAIIASGGLSHFVIDEELDRKVLKAIVEKDGETLKSIPREKLVSGTGETLCWIAAAGALEDLEAKILDYIPAYRTEALTGCGMGFVYWE